MTNPFEAFNISDDEEQKFVANKTDKVRKTHKERRQLKKQSEVPATNNTPVAQELPSKVKQDAKAIRHNRNHGRPNKEVPAGHTLDRRSGTGRVDRPRKEGAARGGFGTVKDELNKEKYQKPEQQVQAPTEEAPVEQTKPQEPQKLTLAEYYQTKGVDISQQSTVRKAPVKTEVNAEWLKKEKLTLLETKEDKRRQQATKQNVLQQNNTRVQNLEGAEFLGFGSKPAQKPREQTTQEPRNNQRGAQKGKKGPQVSLKEEDFPTL